VLYASKNAGKDLPVIDKIQTERSQYGQEATAKKEKQR